MTLHQAQQYRKETDESCSACDSYQKMAKKPLCPKHEEEYWAELQLENYFEEVENHEEQYLASMGDR
jgi:hypothetical protein